MFFIWHFFFLFFLNSIYHLCCITASAVFRFEVFAGANHGFPDEVTLSTTQQFSARPLRETFTHMYNLDLPSSMQAYANYVWADGPMVGIEPATFVPVRRQRCIAHTLQFLTCDLLIQVASGGITWITSVKVKTNSNICRKKNTAELQSCYKR